MMAMPTVEEVKKAIELIRKRQANVEYFFSRLSSPDWIDPLDKEGIFSDPPDAIREGSSISFPSWPAAEYLSRVASSVPEEVLSIMLKVPATGNIRVHDCFARAALAIPGSLAARWAAKERQWLDKQEYLFFLLPESLSKLCQHLSKFGEVEAALQLFRSLFRIVDKGTHSWDTKALFEPWEYESAIKDTYPSLIEAAGGRAHDLLCELLSSTLPDDSQADGENDYSWLMRAAIEPHEQNVAHNSIRDVLIDTVRDAGSLLAKVLPSGSREILSKLAHRRSALFRRLEIYFLAEHYDLVAKEAKDAALDEGNFSDLRIFHEYTRLLRTVFPHLEESYQNKILAWIDAGPTDIAADAPEDLRKRQKENWQLRWLSIIADDLSPEWRARYDEGVNREGAPEHPDLLSYSTTGFGLSSPKTDSELESMNAEEIAAFLRSWQPTNGWDSPVPEGLGRTLQRVVAAMPSRFVESINAFVGVEATYARAMVQGIEEAAKRGESLGWEAVLDFLGWVVSRPLNSENTGVRPIERDPHWGWARRAVASLMSTLFDKSLLPISTRVKAWALLAPLTNDPDPTPVEDQRTSMDAATYSINTTRGEAIHAVVRYALWIRRASAQEGDDAASTMQSFAQMPEVREVLEQHLRTDSERSPAVRAVYGQWLPWLILLDRGWIEAYLSEILPDGDENADLRDAVWDTYVVYCHAYNDCFSVLQVEYAKAIDRLVPDMPAESARRDPAVHLGEHIVLFTGNGG